MRVIRLLYGIPESAFSATEEEEIRRAEIRCKPKMKLSSTRSLDLNGTKLTITADNEIDIQQKGQVGKISLVDPEAPDYAQQYSEQLARGAYLAHICQSEATFGLSVAVQIQEPSRENCTKLNKRLDWQTKNLARGLCFVPVDLKTATLTVFVDGSLSTTDISARESAS